MRSRAYRWVRYQSYRLGTSLATSIWSCYRCVDNALPDRKAVLLPGPKRVYNYKMRSVQCAARDAVLLPGPKHTYSYKMRAAQCTARDVIRPGFCLRCLLSNGHVPGHCCCCCSSRIAVPGFCLSRPTVHPLMMSVRGVCTDAVSQACLDWRPR